MALIINVEAGQGLDAGRTLFLRPLEAQGEGVKCTNASRFLFLFFVALFSCHYPAWFPFDAGHSGKLRTVYPSPLEQDGTGIHLPCFPRFYLFLLLDGRRFFQISCLRPLVLRGHPLSLCVRTCVYNARPLSSQTWNFSTLTNFVVISAVERRRKGWRGRVLLPLLLLSRSVIVSRFCAGDFLSLVLTAVFLLSAVFQCATEFDGALGKGGGKGGGWECTHTGLLALQVLSLRRCVTLSARRVDAPKRLFRRG